MDDYGKNILLYTPETQEISVAEILQAKGYSIVSVSYLAELFDVFDPGKFDLAIIGLAPEQENITDFSITIRSICNVPVLFILPSETSPFYLNQVKTCGDDFLLMPLREEELILRAEMIISCHARRKGVGKDKFSIGNMRFDFKNQVLHTSKGSNTLTRIEAQLLHLLCLHRNKILSRDMALKIIWGENDYFKSRSMDVYVAKLRKLLLKDTSVSISNIHNVGFMLNTKESHDGRKSTAGT
jgi:DNA-binding response OmpR family regulator